MDLHTEIEMELLRQGRLCGAGLWLSQWRCRLLAAGQAAILHMVGLRAAGLQQELPRSAPGRRRHQLLRRRRRRLHQGQGRFRPDIAHPCYDKVARWNKEGLLQPIDTARIKNWDSIFPVFKNLPDLQAGDGKVWMVPWDWGNTSILYRTDLVKDPEASWNLLWDKEYAGRIATIDAVHDTPVVAAILAGVNPFDMTPEELEKVAEKLREQRPLLSAYTTDMTSVEQSLASGALVAAMTWNASANALKKQGLPVAFMKPKEGMLTWACGFVILKDAKNVDLAYDFINSRLEEGSGKYLIEAYGYGSSTKTAFDAVEPATLEQVQLPSDPEVMLKSTVFTGPMKQNDDLAKMFEKIKAGG